MAALETPGFALALLAIVLTPGFGVDNLLRQRRQLALTQRLLVALEKELLEKDKELREKDKLLREKDELLRQKDKELREKVAAERTAREEERGVAAAAAKKKEAEGLRLRAALRSVADIAAAAANANA
jgi:biopolymer transport protein ExbB/TolQ